MRKNNSAARSVKRVNITTKDGKIKDAVYAVGGQEGVFAISCEPDRDGCYTMYAGDDGAWWYLCSYHGHWIKAIVYCISLSR